MIRNPFKLLADLQEKPPLIPAAIIKGKMSDEDKKLIRQIGVTASQIKSDLQADTQINYDRARLYHEIDRACLVGDVEIRLCNGDSIPIKELAENKEKYIGRSVWSINPATLNMEPDKIISIDKTRKDTQIVRVYLDNDRYVDCTPDHRFMLKNGLYKEAQYLQPNVSLMSLHLYTKEDREVMSDCNKVVRVEWLIEKQDTYDLTTEKNHNFPLAAGVFVHNSEHWLVGASIELYADYCTCFSSLHNASVWITSEAPKYQKELTKMLDRIGIEEKIFDWAWTTGAYGDLFVKINGIPELGVISVNDGDHPLNVSRVDHEGVLIGFYQTPQGQFGGGDKELQPPWEFSHFRLLGAKKKRPMYGDPMYAEFRTMHLLIGTSTRQVTTRYGTSLILNGLPVYKRLRLAEDSLLLARLTRGIIRYIWKLKVDSTNMEAVGELVDQYASLVKRARSLDTSADSPYYDSKSNVMGVMEDLFIPVWGDVGDLTYDKIGGEADIKWIVDIEELRNQLACSLRTPLSLLGGFVEEASGALGSDSIEKLDIRFARSSRRLQRALKQGIKRICQVHLAYMNMDPDPNLFEVEMSETSTAEEAELKEALDSGVDVVQKIYDLVSEIPGVNQTKVLNYLNQKVLKLEDFDLENFMDSKGMLPESKKLLEKQPLRTPIYNLDILSYLPLTESKDEVWKSKNAGIWEKKYGSVLVKEAKFSEFQPNVRQGKFKF